MTSAFYRAAAMWLQARLWQMEHEGGEYGVCAQCGAPWERVTRQSGSYQAHWAPGTQSKQESLNAGRVSSGGVMETGFVKEYSTLGWRPGCLCRNQRGRTVPAVVLDPFGGSGTTGRVSIRLGRKVVLVDIGYDGKYAPLAAERTRNVQMELK